MHATEQPLLIAVHSFHVAMRIIGDAARDSFGDGDERCRQWHCKQGQADHFALIDEPLRHMFMLDTQTESDSTCANLRKTGGIFSMSRVGRAIRHYQTSGQ